MKTLVISKETVHKAYSPKTAFGNTALIKAHAEAEAELARKEAIKICGRCDSYGTIYEECYECNGTGRFEKACDHEEN